MAICVIHDLLPNPWFISRSSIIVPVLGTVLLKNEPLAAILFVVSWIRFFIFLH